MPKMPWRDYGFQPGDRVLLPAWGKDAPTGLVRAVRNNYVKVWIEDPQVRRQFELMPDADRDGIWLLAATLSLVEAPQGQLFSATEIGRHKRLFEKGDRVQIPQREEIGIVQDHTYSPGAEDWLYSVEWPSTEVYTYWQSEDALELANDRQKTLFGSVTRYSVSLPAEYTDEDPFGVRHKKPVFDRMQVDWWNLPPAQQKNAIVNAFRATMLSPRMNLKSNAILYQLLMDIDAEESDPDVFESRVRDIKAQWDAQGQTDLFNATPEVVQQEDIIPGSRFLPGFWGNIRRLAALGPYAEDLRQIALADVEEGGHGRHFRENVLALGIPGVGPKVASFAWLALNPTMSDLATIDVWMMKHLQEEDESPRNPKHYYELEERLRTEKDMLYGPDMPLGQYQWGVWDKLRTPGYHQDHAPLRVHEPVPYKEVEWEQAVRAPRPQRLPALPEGQMTFAKTADNPHDRRFQVGDRVELDPRWPGPTNLYGQVATVVDATDSTLQSGQQIWIEWDNPNLHSIEEGYPEFMWKLAEPSQDALFSSWKIARDFQQEDRVRIVHMNRRRWTDEAREALMGVEAMVLKVDPDAHKSTPPIAIAPLTKTNYDYHIVYVFPEEIELAEGGDQSSLFYAKIAAPFDAPVVNPANYDYVPLSTQELEIAYQELSETNRKYFRQKARIMNGRAKKLNKPGRVTAQELAAMYRRYQGKCAYDGGPGATSWDHVIPLGQGGDNTIDNVLPVHSECNRQMNEWDKSLRDDSYWHGLKDGESPLTDRDPFESFGRVAGDLLRFPLKGRQFHRDKVGDIVTILDYDDKAIYYTNVLAEHMRTQYVMPMQQFKDFLREGEWTPVQTKPKTAMAERTGDPELDAAIEEFLVTDEYDVRMYRDSCTATGNCADVTEYFVRWLAERGIEAVSAQAGQQTIMVDGKPLFPPDEGWFPPDWHGIIGTEDDWHDAAVVQKDGHTYLIDWTAAQYGETEFPLVQRLEQPAESGTWTDSDGVEFEDWSNPGWQREWTAASGDFMQFFDDASRGLHAPGTSLDVGFTDSDEQSFYDTYRGHAGEFDSHIETSIPGYRELQVKKGVALTKAFPDATVLDIGGSEGSWAKTVSTLGGQRTINVEPNAAMIEHYQRNPVPGAEIVPQAFLEGFEWDGQTYEKFEPGEQYDIINESMTFQFISPDRPNQVAEVKRLLAPGGLFLTDEKVITDQWAENERVKDEWKQQFFTPEQLQQKQEIVNIQDEESAVGMVANMVHENELVAVLRQHFSHVQRYWKSGNFVGYACSDNPKTVYNFLSAYSRRTSSWKLAMPYEDNVWYHVTDRSRLPMIATQGLVGSEQGTTRTWHDFPVEHGAVYLWPNVNVAWAYKGILTGEGRFERRRLSDPVILRVSGIDRRQIGPDHEHLEGYLDGLRDRLRDESTHQEDDAEWERPVWNWIEAWETDHPLPEGDYRHFLRYIQMLREMPPEWREKIARQISEWSGDPVMHYGPISPDKIEVGTLNLVDENGEYQDRFLEENPQWAENEPEDPTEQEAWFEQRDQAMDEWMGQNGPWVHQDETENWGYHGLDAPEDDSNTESFRWVPIQEAVTEQQNVWQPASM